MIRLFPPGRGGRPGRLSGKKGRTRVQVTVKQLAALVHGQVIGDGDRTIRAARPVTDAGADDVTFVENERNARLLQGSRAAAVVAPAALAGRINESTGEQAFTLILVADPLTAFVAVMQRLHGRPEPPPHGVDPRASVDPTAYVGDDASIHPFAVVGAGSTLGARCRIHSGAV